MFERCIRSHPTWTSRINHFQRVQSHGSNWTRKLVFRHSPSSCSHERSTSQRPSNHPIGETPSRSTTARFFTSRAKFTMKQKVSRITANFRKWHQSPSRPSARKVAVNKHLKYPTKRNIIKKFVTSVTLACTFTSEDELIVWLHNLYIGLRRWQRRWFIETFDNTITRRLIT